MNQAKSFASVDRMSLAGPGAEAMARQQLAEDMKTEDAAWAAMKSGRWAEFDLKTREWAMEDLLKGQTERQNAWNQKMQAGIRLVEQMQTPLERYKAGLTDIGGLLKAGAIDPTTAGRAGLAAHADYMRDLRQPGQEPTFAPAMERGSLEAYRMEIRAVDPGKLQSNEDKQLALLEQLKTLPGIKQVLDQIARGQTKPGTVETAP